jgi:benzoyl-CoA reductase/2-hydroxyglutaryl-CoA dehydratase subunit BcrC/BadD/HgdB
MRVRETGITTTVPVEVILAAGHVPVDLNNRFITHPERDRLISLAEARGFPVNHCAWVKGIYGATLELGIKEVIGVTRGDCSSTEKLLEVFRLEGVRSVPFAFPSDQSRKAMDQEIQSLMRHYGVRGRDVEGVRSRLRPIRRKLASLDRLTWQDAKVSGGENHLWLVSASDFNSDPEKFEADLSEFLEQAGSREPFQDKIRLGYLGVPAIFDDLYDVLEDMGSQVIFNEVQRQFAMLNDSGTLSEQYLRYTYPYDVFFRTRDIRREIKRRGIHAVIHYAQTFCHRQIESIVFKQKLGVPVLSLEGDKPGPVDARTKTRLEAFIEMLRS